MDGPRDYILNEVNHREINVWYHLYVGFKMTQMKLL